MAESSGQNLPELGPLLGLVLSPDRDQRGALVARQRESWRSQAESTLVAEAWIKALAPDQALPPHWRQAEGDLWQALRPGATPGAFAALACLFDLADPDRPEPPHPAFWLGLGLLSDKAENYAAASLAKPWLQLLRQPPGHPVIAAWLQSRNPDCLAFLFHSPQQDTQNQARDLLGALSRAPDLRPDCCDAVLAARRRVGAFPVDSLTTHLNWQWLAERLPQGSALARAWITDPHPEASELAVWLAAGTDAHLGIISWPQCPPPGVAHLASGPPWQKAPVPDLARRNRHAGTGGGHCCKDRPLATPTRQPRGPLCRHGPA